MFGRISTTIYTTIYNISDSTSNIFKIPPQLSDLAVGSQFCSPFVSMAVKPSPILPAPVPWLGEVKVGMVKVFRCRWSLGFGRVDELLDFIVPC